MTNHTLTGREHAAVMATMRWVKCKNCDSEHLVADWPGQPGRLLEFATLGEVDMGEDTSVVLLTFYGPAYLREVQFQMAAPEVDHAKDIARSMVACGVITGYPSSDFLRDQVAATPHEGGTQ